MLTRSFAWQATLSHKMLRLAHLVRCAIEMQPMHGPSNRQGSRVLEKFSAVFVRPTQLPAWAKDRQ